MAALVQTYTQPSTVPMLQNRPSSSGGFSSSQSQQHHNQGLRSPPLPRYNNTSSSGNYRGMPSHGLVAPYAFTSTPQLANTGNTSRQYQPPHLRPEHRTSSAPATPHGQQPSVLGGVVLSPRQRYPTSSSVSTLSSTTLTQATPRNVDDPSIPSRSALVELSNRPQSTLGTPLSSSMTSAGSFSSAKPSPDRYRRSSRHVDSNDSGPNCGRHTSAMPSGSGMAAISHLYSHPKQTTSSPSLQAYQSFRGTQYNAGDQTRKASADDMNLARPQTAEQAKRYRRRSLGSLETAGLNHENDSQSTPSPHPNAFLQPSGSQPQPRDARNSNQTTRPASSHTHNASTDSVSSSRSVHASRPPSVSSSIPV